MTLNEMNIARKAVELACETPQKMCRQSHRTGEELRTVRVTVEVENLEYRDTPHKITARREKK